MKKILLFSALTLGLFTQCDKNDDNSIDHSQDLLIGKWEVKDANITTTLNGIPVEDEDISEDDVIGTIFEFKTGNVINIKSYDSFDEEWYEEEGTYVYNTATNKITITYNDDIDLTDVVEMNVTKLNSTDFDFYIDETETFSDENQDYVYYVKVEAFCKKM